LFYAFGDCILSAQTIPSKNSMIKILSAHTKILVLRCTAKVTMGKPLSCFVWILPLVKRYWEHIQVTATSCNGIAGLLCVEGNCDEVLVMYLHAGYRKGLWLSSSSPRHGTNWVVDESLHRIRSICQHYTGALEVSGLSMNIQWCELNVKKSDQDQGP